MNPTGQPFDQFGAPPPQGPSGGAREALNVPSILFMVFGGISALFALYSFIPQPDPMSNPQLQQMMNDPNMPANFKSAMSSYMGMASGPLHYLSAVLSLLSAGLVIFAGLQMRALKNYMIAVAGSVVIMIPVIGSCCCCITLPIGIWALVILMRPEVKSAFS